jgi:hypothetical protein
MKYQAPAIATATRKQADRAANGLRIMLISLSRQTRYSIMGTHHQGCDLIRAGY